MGKKLLSNFTVGLIGLLPLLVFEARADFLIEFADGRKVTVGHYVEEGQTIKIYTLQGTIGFRKEDVKHITEISTTQSTNTPLETMAGRPSSTTQEPKSTLSRKQNAQETADKAEGAGSEKQKPGEHKLTEADVEQIDQHYQDVNQRYKSLWEKHKQEVRSGASNEELAENRRQLLELDGERMTLKKQVRQQADPDDFPVWAQEKVAQPE